MLNTEESTLMNDSIANEIEPVKLFVTTALHKKLQGESFCYDQLIQQLKTRTDHDILWKLYVGLTSCVSLYIKKLDAFRELIQGILSFDWYSDNRRVLVSYRQLLAAMVSSNTSIIIPLFQTLIKGFINYNEQIASSSASQEASDRKRHHIHKAIQGILQLAPIGHNHLFPIIADLFPHKRFGVSILTEYVSQLQYICEYIPAMQHQILELILGKCLELDVEIVIEDSGDVRIQHNDNDDDNDEAEMFEFDDVVALNSKHRNTTISSHHSSNHNHNRSSIENAHNMIPAEVADTAEKLDALLLLLIQFIDGQLQLAEAAEDPIAASNRLYQHLDMIFHDKILSTHKSKFVQYIIFYLLCKLPRYCDIFAHSLLQLFFDDTMPMIKRQSAVLYLASLLSRCKAASSQLIHDILSELVIWCGSYASLAEPANLTSTNDDLHNHDNTGDSNKVIINYSSNMSYHPAFALEMDELGRVIQPDTSSHATINRHESFFAGVQAACYICCFHGVEIASQQRDSSCLRSDWVRIFTSNLEPLRYCYYSIRIEFLKLALQVGLLPEEVWDHMSLDLLRQEQNQHHNHPQYHHMMTAERINPLDSFFPFDPCLLQAIHHRVEPYYRHWDGVPGLLSAIITSTLNEECVSTTDTDTDMITISRTSSVAASYTSSQMIMGSVDTNGNSHNNSNQNSMMMTSSYVQDVVLSKGIAMPAAEEWPVGPDGWPLPIRQPRHYSIGSTGSW